MYLSKKNLTLDHPDNVYDPIHVSGDNLTLGLLSQFSKSKIKSIKPFNGTFECKNFKVTKKNDSTVHSQK